MTYELSLEYGSFPLKLVDEFAESRRAIPDFIAQDSELIAKLEEVNSLFHELFHTIECQFFYIGYEFPEKKEKVTQLYNEIVQDIKTNYPDQDILIESLYFY
ncbi:hypothetical protein [Streptococcus loxodontisalivarius]|uniref:RND superfamily exporter protein n=1 Tax=Streptococcus loxodontisalivarius TaxID=1349415 RepID=A0ABS2PRM2_9STRE|nr:hypothetical protein [Streptococcus loxodontisalivarius]MBM7642635.1 putative RND superfamily exporter protein [Streptococcus loxodontisalivarius]